MIHYLENSRTLSRSVLVRSYFNIRLIDNCIIQSVDSDRITILTKQRKTINTTSV